MDFLEKNISDEKIKAEYKRIENLDMPQEYHAAHILVKEEETAKKIVEEINDKSNLQILLNILLAQQVKMVVI